MVMATGVAASAKTILVWSRPPSITLLVNHIPPSARSSIAVRGVAQLQAAQQSVGSHFYRVLAGVV